MTSDQPAILQDYSSHPLRAPLPDRLRLPLSFDPEALAQDMARVPADEWVEHFLVQNYEGNWDALPLRCPSDATHPILKISGSPSSKSFVDTPLLLASPYFREVLAAFRCPLLSVRLMRLTPGSRLKEHTDHDLSFESGTVRIHIPVTTNPDVVFLLNRTRIVMEAGSAWYLRLCDPHSVENRGSTDRVHMMIDAVRNDWLRALLDEAVGLQQG